MRFAEPYAGTEGNWWVWVIFDDGHRQPAVFDSKEEALSFIADQGTPARMTQLRTRLGEVNPDASAGLTPLPLPAPHAGPLEPVPVMDPPGKPPSMSPEEESDALDRDSDLQRKRIDNAELRKGAIIGKLPLRFQAKDFISGAIGAVVWAIASKFIGC